MASGPSPPKPWERAGVSGGINTSTLTSSFPASSTATATSTIASAPALPQLPSTLTAVANRTASNYSTAAGGLNTTRYTNSSYGGMGGVGGLGGAYSSPYSRMGGYGSSMYGGMGGMGGMGGYGSMYGGMSGMGGYGGMGGMGGMGADPNDPSSLTHAFSQSTQATFQIIESIVGAFGGFAQMLESTYMATHSSFFAMIQVAEQFSSLRNTLGSILGIFTILRWIRTILAKITGRPPPASSSSLTPANFAAFEGRPILLPDGSHAPASHHPKPSKKPFLVFLLAAFGLPYLMGKLIRVLAKSQEAAQAAQLRQQGLLDANGMPIPINMPGQAEVLDPSKLEFCRLLFDFPPPNHQRDNTHVSGIDLEVKKGDLIAVLSKMDPMGQPSEWWRCRARDGRVGWLPGIYLEAVTRKADSERVMEITSGSQNGSSRTGTMTSISNAVREAVSASKTDPTTQATDVDVSAERSLKGQFYS